MGGDWLKESSVAGEGKIRSLRVLAGRLSTNLRYGRKRLFSITVGLYLVATILTGLSWSFAAFALFRALTGAGIGGEYAAVNSAIQELIPARYRGRTDLIINGSFWVGAALGAAGTLVFLDPALLSPELGWRTAFGIGALLGLVILYLRRFVPESPRWLMIHGRIDEANKVVAEIERRVLAALEGHVGLPGCEPAAHRRLESVAPPHGS